MKSIKTAAVIDPIDLSPEARIRHILAFSLGEVSVSDSDPLEKWSSLDCVEAIVCCERDLEIPEINDDLLLKCKMIGDIVKLCRVQPA